MILSEEAAVETDRDERFQQAIELARGGKAAEQEGDLEGARARYRDALLRVTGDAPTPLLANLLRWIGSTHRDAGETEEADRYYQESHWVAEKIGFGSGQASALNCRAVIAQRRGDLDEATALYRRAARLAAEAGEIRLANIRGDLDGALVRYRASLRAFSQVRDEEAMSWVLNNMGLLLSDLDQFERAEQSYVRALIRTNLSEVLIATGRAEEAEAQLNRSLEIAQLRGEPLKRAEALKFRAMLARTTGHLDDAAVWLQEAYRIAGDAQDRLLRAEVLKESGELLVAGGQREQARAAWEEAVRLFVELDAMLDADRVRQRLATLEEGS